MQRGFKLFAVIMSMAFPAMASADPTQWLPENGGNGHYYEFIDFGGQTVSWDEARADAASRSFNGLTGYLATITSAAENDFLTSRFGAIGFLGGTDSGTEGSWVWADGPEAGSVFFAANAVQPGFYANWNPGEPNNYFGPENYLQFNFGTRGGWNDSRASGNSTSGYYIEFGVSPVPEASSWAMMIFGLGIVGGAMRRRAKYSFA